MPTSKKNRQSEAANSSIESNITANIMDLPGESLYRLAVAARNDNRDNDALEKLNEAWHKLGHPSALIGLWAYSYAISPPGNSQYRSLITPEIINQLQLRASSGQAEELYILGICYQLGLGSDVNYSLAIECYKQAIEQDHAGAMFLRAMMHLEGQGGNVNFPRAIGLLERAIAKGDKYAMSSRALMHQQGLGGEVNYLEAIRLYEQAIELGNISALRNRAYMYQQGLGGDVDYLEAIRLYELVIAQGDAEAMTNLALMHRKGQGGDVNFPEAIRLYEKAIALGSTNAMNNLAFMHQEGLGGDVNFPEAIRLYEQAIELGSTNAMHNRALMHRKGQGGVINYPRAIDLLERAIKLGSVNAFIKRALMSQENMGNNPEDAASLLPLLWRDLLEGKFFFEGTYAILSEHCKDDILTGLIDEVVDENSAFYLGVDALRAIAHENHPLAHILGAHDEPASPEYQKLIEHIETLRIDLKRGELAQEVFSDETNINFSSGPPGIIAGYLKGSGLFAKGKPSPVAPLKSQETPEAGSGRVAP